MTVSKHILGIMLLTSLQFIYNLCAWTSELFGDFGFLSFAFKLMIPLLISSLTSLSLGVERLSFLPFKIHLGIIKFAVLIKPFGRHWSLEHAVVCSPPLF